MQIAKQEINTNSHGSSTITTTNTSTHHDTTHSTQKQECHKTNRTSKTLDSNGPTHTHRKDTTRRTQHIKVQKKEITHRTEELINGEVLFNETRSY